MTGVAVLSRDGDGLMYRETGDLQLGEMSPIRAERSYLWRPGGVGRVTVAFADGRPFHDIALIPRPEAEHFCDPDQYSVRYDFGDWPRWTAVWRVKGPRKDYRMTTRYAPLALGPGMGETEGDQGFEDGRGA